MMIDSGGMNFFSPLQSARAYVCQMRLRKNFFLLQEAGLEIAEGCIVGCMWPRMFRMHMLR